MSFKNTCSFLNGLICSLVSYLSHQNINFMRAETLFCLWYDPQNLVQLLSSVQISRSVMSDSVTPWTAARQATLSITNSPSSLKLHVHRVGDAIQPSHPLSSPSPPAPKPSQQQSLFQWVNSLHEVAKVLELQLQLQHQSFQWTPRTDPL